MNTSVDVRGSPTSSEPPLATPVDSIARFFDAAKRWSGTARYDVVVMLTVAASVMVVLFETYPAQNYAFAAALGGLLLRCFPVEPMLSISGLRPLPWRTVRLAHND